MNNETQSKLEHERCMELIAEHVNGQLDSEMMRRMQTHIAQCTACFELQQDAIAIRDSLNVADESLEQLLQSGRREENLAKTLSRLDGIDKTVTSPSWIDRLLLNWTRVPRGFQFAFAAQCMLLVVGVTFLLSSTVPLGPDTSGYRTFMDGNSAAADTSGRRYRVIFESGASEGDIRALMISLKAEVVGGPSVAGAYTIASSQKTPDDAEILQTLRANRWVRFAETASY